MKKIIALALALMMVLSLAVTASATEADLTGHTYTAFQIFKGTQAEGSAELGNVEWGEGVNGDALLAALKAAGDKFDACTSAQAVADVMADWADSGEDAEAFAKLAYAHKKGTGTACVNGDTTLDAGYYLVVDTTDFAENAENTVYNLALLQLTQKETFVIANKTDVPEVQKKVDDENDSVADDPTTEAVEGEDGKAWNDSADHDIGDSVPFQLKATLADNVADYAKYKIVFHDTMSKGLTFEEITKVTVDGKVITDGYTVNPEENADGTTSLTITFENVKNQGAKNSSVVIIEYTAELNEEAEIGYVGNPNYVYLEYSNNPNWEGDLDNDGIPNDEDDDDDNDGKKDDEDDDDDNDGTPDDKEDKEPTGKTPEDKVIVFTYQVVVNKTHQIGEDEEGNPIYEELPGAGFTLYKKDAEGKWVAVPDGDEDADNEIYAENMSQFNWVGLDDGDYKLEETHTPAGYNTIAPIEFTVTADHDIIWEAQAQREVLNTLTGDKFTGDVETGALTSDVENKAGTTLPETGGMGTTIFYAIGGLLVAAAVILLVTKKRMATAE